MTKEVILDTISVKCEACNDRWGADFLIETTTSKMIVGRNIVQPVCCSILDTLVNRNELTDQTIEHLKSILDTYEEMKQLKSNEIITVS